MLLDKFDQKKIESNETSSVVKLICYNFCCYYRNTIFDE